MSFLRGIPVAFSMYTKVPVKMKEFKDGDLKRGFMFYPLTGILMGGACLLMYLLSEHFALPIFFTAAIMFLLPLILTGGLHTDGFMDVSDAVGCWKDREEKLKILKDPHIGAFSVIAIIRHCVFYFAFVYLWLDKATQNDMYIFALIFVLSRAVCGISCIALKLAKQEGFLYEETQGDKKGLWISFIIFASITIGLMLYIDIIKTVAIVLILVLFFIYYRYFSYRHFGGITGDTAGWFLTISEGIALVSVFI